MAMASLIQCSAATSFSATRGGDSTGFFSPFTARFSKTHKSRLRCSLDDNVSDMSVNGLYFTLHFVESEFNFEATLILALFFFFFFYLFSFWGVLEGREIEGWDVSESLDNFC